MTDISAQTIEDKLMRLRLNVELIEDILKASDEDILKGSDKAKYPAIEHMLQISIQIILDVGTHILVERFNDTPASYEHVINELAEHDVITDEFAKSNEGIGKFRNVLVHDYGKVDPAKVLEYARKAPETFRIFGKAFVAQLE